MPDSNLPKKKKTFQSISYFFFLAFLGLSSLILLIEGSISIYLAFRNEQANISLEQKRAAEEAGKTVQNYIEDKFTLMDVVATTTDLITKNPQEQEKILDDLLRKDSTFTQIILLTATKETLATTSRSSQQFSNKLDNKFDKDLFPHVLEGEKHASYAYIDPTTNQPHILLAIPIKDNHQIISKILVAEVSLKNMWDVISNIPVGENGTLYVVDNNGYLLAHKDKKRVLTGENVKELYEVQEYMSQSDSSEEDESVITEGINGTKVVTTYFKLRNEPPWGIIIEKPVLDAFRPVIQEIILLILVMLLTFILAIFLSMLLTRRITKQIVSLNTAAKKISMGDLSASITVTSNDEIGELAESFKEMTKKVQESHKALEEKVTEKTAELESKANETDRMNRLMVGRELKMIEHKEEIARLKAEIEKIKAKN